MRDSGERRRPLGLACVGRWFRAGGVHLVSAGCRWGLLRVEAVGGVFVGGSV